MLSRLFSLLLIFFISLTPSLYSAGTTSANFLKITPGARASGVGEAFTSIANDASAIYWNTAGLSSLKSKEITFSHNMWFQDIGHSFVAFGLPLEGGRDNSSGKCLGVSVTYLDMGGMERKTENTYTDQGTFGASDMCVAVAFSRQVPGYPGLSAGVSAKVIRQVIAEYSANAYALDFGLLKAFRVRGLPLSAGISVHNIGTPLKFIDEAYPLPASCNLGLSVLQLPFTVALDVSFPNDNSTNWKIGTEYTANNMFVLRAGYNNRSSISANALSNTTLGPVDNTIISELTGFMAGFGLSIPLRYGSNDKLDLDYAFVPHGDLGNSHRISLGLKW